MAKNSNSNSAALNSAPTIVGGMRTGARRRQTGNSNSASNSKQQRRPMGGNTNSILKFYGDDSPGFKLTPQTVLIVTLVFMATVVMLHIINKL